MAPAPVRAKYANSESVFKPDIFKGKVLFCTGGGSGICKEMTYAMVSRCSLRLPFLLPLSMHHPSFGLDAKPELRYLR